ncbi:hypothetical protein DIJ61_27550 [Burkholderia pseudomallei]|nr:hypothetical protein DIJ61_27550 [Burkholderia pseudomallei]
MGVVTSHRPPPSAVRRDGSAHAQAAPCRSSGNRRPSDHPRTGYPADAAIAVPTARRTDRRPPRAATRRKPARRTREIVRISGDAAMRPRSAHDPVKDKCRPK